MSEPISVESQQIATYRKENPSAQKLTDKQILLIMAQENRVNLDKGVKLEKTTPETSKLQNQTPKFQNISAPMTEKEAEDTAIKTISSNADSALKTLEEQDNGDISELYESIKEKTGSKLVASNVKRVAYAQKESADILQLAQNKELTYADYYRRKNKILLDTFPLKNMTKAQKDSVSKMIVTLSPKETEQMIEKSLALPNESTPNYKEKVNEFLAEFKDATTTTSIITKNGDNIASKKIQRTPKKPFKPQNGERLIPFEEAYQLELGVNFKKENIETYNKSAIEFAEASKHTQTKDFVHKLLDDNIILVDGNNKNGIDPQTQKSSENRLELAIRQTLSNFYGNDETDMSKGLKELTGENFSFQNGKLQMDIPANSGFVYNTNGSDLVRIAKRMRDKIDENYAKVMKGKSLDTYAKNMAEASKHTQTKDFVHKLLDDNIILVDGNNKNGIDPQTQKSSENRLELAIRQTLSNFYGNDETDMSKGLKELTGENFSFQNGKLQMDIPANSGFVYNTNGSDLVRIAKRMRDKIDENYAKVMKGKSLDTYAKNMAEANKTAYGIKNAAQLAEAYRQDQNGIVKKVRAGIEYAGTGILIAGVICYPPVALAGGLITSFGGLGAETLEEKTKKRPNPEKIKELKQEFITNTLLMATGASAGKAGAAAKTLLTAKNCPKLLATVADIGTDATLSLLSDMALTGQINLEGEGFSQIMSIIAGHKGKLVSGAKFVKDNVPTPSVRLEKLKIQNGDDALITHKFIEDGKEKVVVDNETSKTMRKAAENLHNMGLQREDNIAKIMKDAGFGTDETQVMTHRTKGNQSLYDKLKNYAIDNIEKSKTIKDAINSVKDLIGTRTAIKSVDFTKHPEVAKLIKEGKMKEAQTRAAELQSEPTLNKLKAIIDKESAGNKTLSIERISNYKGKDGIPYFSDRQLADLKLYAEQHGVKLNYVVRAAESDPKFAQMKQDYANQKEATKVRESGYTALQINFKLANGQVFEWQFRGDKVNVFAEAEHVPYDLRTGKDIISAHPEVKPLYEPIQKLLSKNSMTDAQFTKYNEYLTDYYKHLRKLELGFESTEPKLSDYGNLDKRLSGKNLENLHTCAEEIKKHPEQTERILQKYKQLVNN